MRPDPTAAAFFDIDNTLIHGASMFHWARGLAKHKYLSKGQILDFVWKQTRFIVVGKEHAEDLHDVTEEALALVEGRNQAELVQLTREIFNEYMIDRFWPGTVALAQGHLDLHHVGLGLDGHHEVRHHHIAGTVLQHCTEGLR